MISEWRPALSVGFRADDGASPDNNERELAIFVRIGKLGLEIATQGGVRVPLTDAVRLARTAEQDITTERPGVSLLI